MEVMELQMMEKLHCKDMHAGGAGVVGDAVFTDSAEVAEGAADAEGAGCTLSVKYLKVPRHEILPPFFLA